MAYDEKLAACLRELFAGRTDVEEKQMFGGLAFMVAGHMCCGIVGRDLMVRVGPEQHAAALALPHARVMDFTGRPSRNMIYVAPAGVATPPELSAWVARALRCVAALPDKPRRQRSATKRDSVRRPSRARR